MRLPWAVVATSLAGMAVSGYLLWHKLAGGALVCLTGHGCDVVNASPYSMLFGIPVAGVGLAAYLALAILGTLWALGAGAGWAALGAFGVALAGFLYSAYLTWIEAAVLRAYCTWCLFSAGLMTAELVLTGAGLFRPPDGTAPD